MKPLSNLKQNASVQKTELPLMQQIAAFLFSKKIKKRAFARSWKSQ